MSIGRKNENFSKLCLIGMSGVGKSFWAEKFQNLGFQVVSCDQRICEHILQKIGSADEVISSLGTWLGFPWEPGFSRREATYLTLEDEYMYELSARTEDAPTLLDSTGSLIYCSPETLSQVKENYLIVYLQLNPEKKQQIIGNYCSAPRPILWNNRFPADLTNPDAEQIKVQLNHLIEERENLYQELADLTILSSELQSCQQAEDLLTIIQNKHAQR